MTNIGCDGSEGNPEAVPAATVNLETEATRLYGIAQNLEKEGKTKDARGVYLHLLRAFPKAVQAKKARERIRLLPPGR